jgi:hypothetical protein
VLKHDSAVATLMYSGHVRCFVRTYRSDVDTERRGATGRGGCQVDPRFGPNTGRGKTPRHCEIIITDVNCILQRVLNFGI